MLGKTSTPAFLWSAAFFQQIGDGLVIDPGFRSQADFAGAVGGNAAGTTGRRFAERFIVNFAQGMLVEFWHDKTAITAKTAAGDTGGFNDFLDAGGQ